MSWIPIKQPDLSDQIDRAIAKFVPSVRRGAGRDAMHGVTRLEPTCLVAVPAALERRIARYMNWRRRRLASRLRRLRAARPGAQETAFDRPVTDFVQTCQTCIAVLEAALMKRLDPDAVRALRTLRIFCIEHDRDETPDPTRSPWAIVAGFLWLPTALIGEAFAVGYVLRDVSPTHGGAVVVG